MESETKRDALIKEINELEALICHKKALLKFADYKSVLCSKLPDDNHFDKGQFSLVHLL
jgi:hypothetical protein